MNVSAEEGLLVLEDLGQRRVEQTFVDGPEGDRGLQPLGAAQRRIEVSKDAWRVPRRQQANLDDAALDRLDARTLTRHRSTDASDLLPAVKACNGRLGWLECSTIVDYGFQAA
jgi:hypothetical protein